MITLSFLSELSLYSSHIRAFTHSPNPAGSRWEWQQPLEQGGWAIGRWSTVERKREWIQISQTHVHAPHHICQSHICTAHMCNRNATAGSVQSFRVMWHETAQHSKFTHESRSSFCTSSLHEKKHVINKKRTATKLGKIVKTLHLCVLPIQANSGSHRWPPDSPEIPEAWRMSPRQSEYKRPPSGPWMNPLLVRNTNVILVTN